MTCNICNDDYGIKICSCSYLICNSCINKLTICPKCPQCRKNMEIKYYIAGKIRPKKLFDETNNDVDNDKIVDDFRWNNNDLYKRIIIGANEDILEDISYPKTCDLQIPRKNMILLKDYKNLQNKIKPIDFHKNKITKITGPGLIVNNIDDWSHGILNGNENNFSNLGENAMIVNKRNDEMISNCDVFVLQINKETDCFYAFSEWGIAKATNKILLLDITTISPNIDIGEFYMYAIDSLNCFEKLDFTRRNAILNFCPIFSNIDYLKYKNFLEFIIQFKQKNSPFHKKKESILKWSKYGFLNGRK